MKKLFIVLSFINFFFIIVLSASFVQYLIQSSLPDAGWIHLGFFLIAFSLLIIALILSIPFLIFFIKYKFKLTKLYIYSHLSYLILSIIVVLYSLQG